MPNIFDPSYLMDFILGLPWILLAFSFHEFCHAMVSYRLGDPTPEREQRLTLNPIRHIDPIGMITIALFGFGWAKPVQINPRYYKNPVKGMLFVALAGPAGNFILAVLLAVVIRVIAPMGITLFRISVSSYLVLGMVYNLRLGIFNLIPIPPLDGSKVLRYFLRGSAGYQFDRIEPYGFYILILFLILNLHYYILNPAVSVLSQLLLGRMNF